MPNTCLSAQPYKHANIHTQQHCSPNGSNKQAGTAGTSGAVHQHIKTGTRNSHTPWHCLPTQPSRHARQPTPAPLVNNTANQACQTTISCSTVHQLSQTGMSNSHIVSSGQQYSQTRMPTAILSSTTCQLSQPGMTYSPTQHHCLATHPSRRAEQLY